LGPSGGKKKRKKGEGEDTKKGGGWPIRLFCLAHPASKKKKKKKKERRGKGERRQARHRHRFGPLLRQLEHVRGKEEKGKGGEGGRRHTLAALRVFSLTPPLWKKGEEGGGKKEEASQWLQADIFFLNLYKGRKKKKRKKNERGELTEDAPAWRR